MRMWAFPHLTRFAIAADAAIVAAMAFIPDQRAPLVFGIVSVIVLLVAYVLRRAVGTQTAPAS